MNTAIAQPRIDVKSVSKNFVLHQRGGTQLAVLNQFSMQVNPSECVALTGPSGRGKSTVVKCLYGSYSIDGGQVTITTDQGPVDMRFAPAQTILMLRKQTVAYVSQFLRAIPRVPTVQLVAARFLEGAAGRLPERGSDSNAQAKERAEEILARLRVPKPLWSLPPATFSGGEQQRVNLACCFVRPSPVLLLDEPTASLDNENRNVVIDLIREARDAGSSIVGIFHDSYVREAVADRCVEVAP